MISTESTNDSAATDAPQKTESPTPKQDASNDAVEEKIENTLRPKYLKDYVGQAKIKKQLEIFIGAAKKRGEALEHALFYGPAGLGKTTLANILAREMNVNLKTTSGPALERVGDLGAILTNLQDGDVLFIDEIHRLSKTVEEVLYGAMEDYKLDLVVGKGPSAQTLQIDLPKFTLVGATTRMGALTAPLRDRFGVVHKLEFYTPDEIAHIITRSADILTMPIDTPAANLLAAASRRTPRVANRILKRARDYADMHEHKAIDSAVAKKTLDLLEIDEHGLEPMDRRLLETVIDVFEGGPVGLGTLANTLSEETQTIEDVYEPYLMQRGLLARSPRGRVVTAKARDLIKKMS